MKKYLIVFLFYIFLPLYTHATSGSCSYHGGVNCSAGASYNGKVQCADGWINSSVYFLEASECQTPVDNCPKIVYGMSCNTESDYTRVKQKVDSMRGSQAVMMARNGLLGSSFGDPNIGQDELNTCREEIKIYNEMVSSRNKCLNNNISLIEKERDIALDNICSSAYPFTKKDPYSNKCICIDDYQMYNSKCVTNNEYFCHKSYGENAHTENGGSCVCNRGYYLNEKDKCVYGTKTTIELTEKIKRFLDFGNSCINSQSFSQTEMRTCLTYSSNPKYYDVIIVDSLDETTVKTQQIITKSDSYPKPTTSTTNTNSLTISNTQEKELSQRNQIKSNPLSPSYIKQSANNVPSNSIPKTLPPTLKTSNLIEDKTVPTKTPWSTKIKKFMFSVFGF